MRPLSRRLRLTDTLTATWSVLTGLASGMLEPLVYGPTGQLARALWTTEDGFRSNPLTSRRHHTLPAGAAMFHRRHVQPFTDPPGTNLGRAEPMPQPLEDVYLLFLNRPPDDVPPGDGGATVVAAGSLHHPELPQPDALRLFDRLARQPARHAGALVFLSDLTAELANEGLTWPEVGIDYEAVTDRVVALHRRRALRAMRLTQLSDVAVTLLASGPHVQVHGFDSDGQSPALLDPILFQVRREELRTMIRADLERMVARGSFL